MTERTKIDAGVLLVMIGIVMVLIPIISSLRFDWNCGEYLKRAADCSTPEQCGKELDLAIKYMRDNGLTSGNSGIIFKTPVNDVEFWYNNIGGARAAIREIECSESRSPLERSNVLIRVRETLLDAGKEVTLPDHIGLYPNVVGMWVLVIVGIAVILGGALIILCVLNDDLASSR